MIDIDLPSGASAKLDMIPSTASRLAFVCAFLDQKEMRRLFTGSMSATVCAELGLPYSKYEAENCKTIEDYYRGNK